MPTRAEIIEAGAQVLHDSKCGDHPVSECARTVARQAETLTEAALSAMLPLIKAQFAADVRELHQPVSKLLGRGWGGRIGEVASFCNRCHQSLYPCATIRLIEGYEPAP